MSNPTSNATQSDLRTKTIKAARALIISAATDLTTATLAREQSERLYARALPADLKHRLHILTERQADEAAAERALDAAALILSQAINASVRAAQGLPEHGRPVRLGAGANDAERSRILKARARNAKP